MQQRAIITATQNTNRQHNGFNTEGTQEKTKRNGETTQAIHNKEMTTTQ